MNPIYVVLLGIYFKWKKVPIYLWYVHRKVDLKLRVATSFSKKVFSSARESFRIQTPKAVFLGHGIETENFPYSNHASQGDKLYLSHIGRITPIKNLEILIEAGKKMKESGVKIEIHLFGECATKNDHNYKEKLMNQITDNGLQNEVFFEGAINPNDLSQKLLASHISVNLTPPGGMDKVVLESLLLGLPVFVSNTAFREVLGEAHHLFLFEFRNPSYLANKISNFINTANREEFMVKLSHKVRNDFSLNNLIEKMVSLMK